METKLWANSGDSHFLEPDDLWQQILPKPLADRMPRSEKVGDDEEIIHVDGKTLHRKLPKIMTRRGETGETISELSSRPPGSRDARALRPRRFPPTPARGRRPRHHRSRTPPCAEGWRWGRLPRSE